MGVITVKKCPVCGGQDLESFLQVKDHSISGESFEIMRCSDCGLGITQRHPDRDSIDKYYASEDYISHSDTAKGVVNRLYHAVRSFMLGRKQELVDKHASKGKLLDIGAGTGYFAAHMKGAGWDVIGLEPDEGARQVARENFDLKMNDIAELYNLPDRSFDVVTMWHVLEHVHNLNGDLDEITRVLKLSGTLVIAVPNPTSSDAGKYKEAWAAFDVPRHLWHFSPESMNLLLGNHGFELIETRSMPFDAFYVSMLSEK